MAVFEVTYEVPCLLRVRARSEEEALEIAAENARAPFDGVEPLQEGEEGILQADAGEAHDFEATEVVVQKQGEVKAWLK